jgi:N6-adenosine-specific RNA methylase IME4
MIEPLPHGPFSVILADPPWTYSVFSAKGEARSAKRHYQTMSLADICAMPIAASAADDAHLFLWATTPNLPQALKVMESWGFAYSSTAFVWVKTNKRQGGLFFDQRSWFVGMGHTTRQNAELVLLGRRGKPKRLSRAIRQIVVAPRREHSRKPDEVHERIESYASGPYLELFARQSRPGWTVWGNQSDKFDAVAA